MWWNSGSGWRHTLTVVLLSLASVLSAPVSARTADPAVGKAADATIAATQLPAQGREILTLIYQGGPFRYDKDGTVFGNRERLLPSEPRGYYREYTVRTPGVSHRGARRIVCGGRKPTQPDACYYTEDHYASFRRIVH
jgi:ribonuclease T1